MAPEIVHAARSVVAAVPPAPVPKSGNPAEQAHKQAIARAVWSDLLWLMPQGRTVTVTVRDDTVAVELGPAEA